MGEASFALCLLAEAFLFEKIEGPGKDLGLMRIVSMEDIVFRSIVNFDRF